MDHQIERQISSLLTEFCWRVDHGEGERVALLFTDDASVHTPHFELKGRKEIHEWFSKRADPTKRVSKHFWSNLRITQAETENEFCATANAMTVVGAPPIPCAGAEVAIGESTELIQIQNGSALFKSRKLTLSFTGKIEPPEKQT